MLWMSRASHLLLSQGPSAACTCAGTANEALTNPVFKRPRHAEDAKGKALAAQPEPELDDDDLLNLKRRMLDLLWPAETALDALRRLGGQQGAGRASRDDALPWKKTLKRGGLRRHAGVVSA